MSTISPANIIPTFHIAPSVQFGPRTTTTPASASTTTRPVDIKA